MSFVGSFSSGRDCSLAELCLSEQTNGDEQVLADARADADGRNVERVDGNGLSGSAFDLGFSHGDHPDPAGSVVLRIEAETELETRVRPFGGPVKHESNARILSR
jgi:hypothetical protein